MDLRRNPRHPHFSSLGHSTRHLLPCDRFTSRWIGSSLHSSCPPHDLFESLQVSDKAVRPTSNLTMTGPDQSSLLSETTTSSSSGGLHNLVTGLTGQSPGLTPSQGSLRSPAPSILEQTSPPRAPASATNSRPDVPAPSLFASAIGANSSSSHDPTPSSSTRPPISNTHSSRPASSRRNIHSRTGPEPERVRHMTAAKEVDDPSQPVDRNSPPNNSGGFTPIELTRLFAVTSMATPSRQPSFEKLPAGTSYTRGMYLP